MRAHNFCAGPAALPTEVLEQARNELLDYQGLGVSIMEMSHRDPRFVEVAERAEQNLRTLMGISNDYAVLFVQGGASAQFSAIPLNLAGLGGRADYLVSGTWSKKAAAEAARYIDVNVVSNDIRRVAAQSEWQLSRDATYFHYASNETIGGIEISNEPIVDVPLVADMSSNILSKQIDVNRYGVIYAGAQKNIGPAGLAIVIVHKSLLGKESQQCPATMNWANLAEAGSMYNTPPTYSWYLAGLVFDWLLKQGGVEAIEKVNAEKARRLYQFIDESAFYSNPVELDQRSRMNVPFLLADSGLDKRFIEESEAAGLMNLKGHRSVGGMRASIYNALSLEAVDALVDFMAQFERKYG